MSKLIHEDYSSRTYAEDEYKLEVEWDDSIAREKYVLYQRTKHYRDGFNGAYLGWKIKASSYDKSWYDRQKEHYEL